MTYNRIQLVFRKIVRHVFWKRCPICNTRIKKYEVAGTNANVWKELHGVGAGRRHTVCPNCNSVDRERLVYLFLRDYYLPKHSHPIKCLHIAPEKHITDLLKKQSNVGYTAGDKRCEGYSYPSYVADIDIMSMPQFQDDTYDLIICNHVLEHVPTDITAMQELRRVLKPTGIAILQVPIALKLDKTIEDNTITTPEQRYQRYGQSDHMRIYGTDYANRIQQSGFQVDKKNITSHYSSKAGLNPMEDIYICHKTSEDY